MKKRFIFSSSLLLVLLSGLFAPIVSFANEDTDIYVIPTEKPSNDTTIPTPDLLQPPLSNDTFEEKTEAERHALSETEQELVTEIETYLSSQINPYSRSLTEKALNQALVDLTFEFGIKRENLIFSKFLPFLTNIKGTELDQESLNWFNNLTNRTNQRLTVFDKPTNRNILLSADYIDNQADTTIVVHHGYRSNAMNLLLEAKFFSDQGYNVLLPNARSHGNSEGQYITFGLYEKEDLNRWLDLEVVARPNQTIYLYGVSMGAATIMLSQETPHPNVKGLIEDCGYATVEQQFRDMIRFVTDYVQYVPGFNLIDWYSKETTLLELLNERHLVPTLDMDLFSVSPLESVRRSGLPTLFIHGDADWFIKPVAKDLLFENAIGYKEQLNVPNAAHAVAFTVGGEHYKEKVLSFIETVEQLETQAPVVAEDLNLLLNPAFNFSATSFDNWLTSTNGRLFANTELPRTTASEFVLIKEGKENNATLSQYNQGLRLFTRYDGRRAYVGQEIPVIAGQTYELSFDAKNDSKATYTYPNIIYGFNYQLNVDSLKNKKMTTKTATYTATDNQPLLVKLGTYVGYHSWIDHHFIHVNMNNLSVVNNDRTPPQAVTITGFTTQSEQVIIKGRGEENTTILIRDLNNQLVSETTTDAKGSFTLTVNTQVDHGILHIVNADIKGNTSASKVLVFQ